MGPFENLKLLKMYILSSIHFYSNAGLFYDFLLKRCFRGNTRGVCYQDATRGGTIVGLQGGYKGGHSSVIHLTVERQKTDRVSRLKNHKKNWDTLLLNSDSSTATSLENLNSYRQFGPATIVVFRDFILDFFVSTFIYYF